MAGKVLMMLIAMIVVGGFIAVRVICSVYAVRRQDGEDMSRWENEGGAAAGQREWLTY